MTVLNVDGVYSSGIHCGIKQNKDLDLAFIYVPDCVGSAIVQTQNLIRSVTIDHNELVFKDNIVKLMIINSGNANSVTGEIGKEHVRLTVEKAAEVFDCSLSEVGIASTGIIGVPLPIESILSGLDMFSINEKNGEACSSAILTTDLIPKVADRTVQIQGVDVTFSGITKGSGMIEPNMATTLGFLVTDLYLTNDQCQTLLTSAINKSYNMISVDGDCSTNDLVSFQSSGRIHLQLSEDDLILVEQTLTDLAIDLAKQIVRDGEGAHHFVEVDVTGAVSVLDAKKVAKLVINSLLVKTAIAGEDPNWGRIMMAIGKDSSIIINESKISITLNDNVLFLNGVPESINRDVLADSMANSDINILINIGDGDHSATVWGCDLTHDYIKINTAYN